MMAANSKYALLEQYAELARALAHTGRLELLELLARGEWSIDALARNTGLSVANASQHLIQLKRAGFVNARREGRYVIYQLRNRLVPDMLALLRRSVEQNQAEVRAITADYFENNGKLEAVARDKCLKD